MDTELSIRALAAFAFVLGLMYLLSFALKKFGAAGTGILSGSKRRLKIVEFLPLDAKRKLVLIRRDQKEHLFVLGPGGETLVEGNIPAPADNVVELVQKDVKNG